MGTKEKITHGARCQDVTDTAAGAKVTALPLAAAAGLLQAKEKAATVVRADHCEAVLTSPRENPHVTE